MFKPVVKKSVSDAVYEQLRDRIVRGDMEPGENLPSERALSDVLGVNRGAVREALKRLEQARLVAIHQGGATRVLDFRETAGTDLIGSLLLDNDGQLNLDVARSVMELRSALGSDIARLCALRSPEAGHELLLITMRMRSVDSLETLQILNMEFWEVLVRGSQNVAYRLAFNSIRELYSQMRELMAVALEEELRDIETHQMIASAVLNTDSVHAEQAARALNTKGESRVSELTRLLE